MEPLAALDHEQTENLMFPHTVSGQEKFCSSSHNIFKTKNKIKNRLSTEKKQAFYIDIHFKKM